MMFPNRTFPIAVAHPARLRLLLVDDSPTVRMSTRSLLLSRWQMDLHVVPDGEQALKAARGREFDIVLMDLDMPVMDGYQATRGIRLLEAAEPARRRAAVIAHTTSDWEPLVARIAGSGIDTVLVKPSAPDLMCRTLHRWAAGKVHRIPNLGCDGQSVGDADTTE